MVYYRDLAIEEKETCLVLVILTTSVFIDMTNVHIQSVAFFKYIEKPIMP